MGFLDQFTVTMSRQTKHLAVEDWSAFDRRFGVDYERDSGRPTTPR